jgi:hypothetical protein
MHALTAEVKTKIMTIAEIAKTKRAELTQEFGTVAANISETTNIVRERMLNKDVIYLIFGKLQDEGWDA